MAKEYNVGDRLYLPVWITAKESNIVVHRDNNEVLTDAKFSYLYWRGESREGEVRYGEEGLLLTAEEVAQDVNTERDDALEELKSRNAELEALLKEVMATRDEAVRQINELLAENKKLKAENDEWQKTARCYSDNAYSDLELTRKLRAEVASLKAERDTLNETVADRTKDVQYYKAESERLNAYYMEANRTASEAAEANEDLKAKIADLRNRVGEQLAQIQDLNAEIHFHKEFGEGLDKQHKELQARYDELDSVNKEQAEKIRKLDKALTDLKKKNDDLQDENTNLTFLLEDAPEKETTKTLHVALNDGTEIEFRRYTAYDYRTDINMFVVKDGERYIAGFLRGDKPTNFAYWWTE